ncbi:SDR family oxidoreductase [Reinekea blandensis]|uniref:sulfoacetaldehyde reductase (NADPH) n=1 Tax=Reinekea blandensis MED297 TaxID=314283 RepID=A4BGH3_9GAMM|nr:SDR family oxidoreductase [Reinekea blandensis]EAR08779.1 oxidoreductase, short-chain dehydrogenase/reductase family protein [Reinekea sp. MED297] [Reinekea blandensis MED297]
MYDRIKDKVIIITGASSGIGEATARRLAAEGANVVVGARREDRLKAIADSVTGAEVLFQATDVTKPEQVESLVKLAMDRFGRVDAIFNNAGIMPTANLSELHRDEWQQMLDINIMGVLNGIAAVLPIMKEQKSGHILTTDSVAGHVVYPGSAVYCGTKFAVRAIMEGLRQEERESNIRSTIISPGLVSTELYQTIADKEFGEQLRQASEIPGVGLSADDIADAVAYAVSTPDTVAVSEVLIRPTQQVV